MYTTSTNNIGTQLQQSNSINPDIFVTGRKSYYDFINSKNDQRNNVGFEYEGQIFANSLSNVTYNGDNNRMTILSSIENVMFNMIESVKRIRNFRNYIVPKNNKYVR